jgi:hypothetical protein
MSAVAIVFIVLGVLLLLVLAVVVFIQVPEIRRYLKARSM